MAAKQTLTPYEGVPGGSMVKNLPANARDMSLIHGLGKVSHAAERLSSCVTTIKACALEPGNCTYWAHVAQLQKLTQPGAHAPQEKPMHCN